MTPQRAREASVLRDAQRRADSSAPRGEKQDSYITSLKARVEKGEVRLFDHLLLLLRNAFDRGARQEALEAVFHTGLSIVRSWYSDRESSADLKTLVENETIAQANADVASWDLAHASPRQIAEAEALCSVHLIQLARLTWRLREMKHAQQLPPAA